jgi:hypothetical protein
MSTLDGQIEGLSAADAKGRKEAKGGAQTAGAKRARAEDATANALAKEKFTMDVDTPEKRAEAWLKKNKKVLGIGNRAKFFNAIKAGKTPDVAAKEAGL